MAKAKICGHLWSPGPEILTHGRHGPYLMGDEKLELSQQQRQSHQQLGTLPRKIVIQQG